jgi:hypothetical protein
MTRVASGTQRRLQGQNKRFFYIDAAAYSTKVWYSRSRDGTRLKQLESTAKPCMMFTEYESER